MKEEPPRKLSRNESHDPSMIIKDRSKVLRAHAEEQAAACMADFERQMATVYTFDQDEVWQKAAREAQRVVQESQDTIAKRCKQLGIPSAFAPSISASWQGRGENMLVARRTELRRVAQTSIATMTKAAITKIEKQALDLCTQVVGMGLLSPDAKMFHLAPDAGAGLRRDRKEVGNRAAVAPGGSAAALWR
jgi:hypothetical protein